VSKRGWRPSFKEFPLSKHNYLRVRAKLLFGEGDKGGEGKVLNGIEWLILTEGCRIYCIASKLIEKEENYAKRRVNIKNSAHLRSN